MPEITLADLLAWETRIRPYTSGAATGDLADHDRDREVSWVVSARATTPMLPTIRGGEVVLLPTRVLADTGVALPILLRELAGHGITAVVLDRAPAGDSPVPVLISDSIPGDLETDVNRLLTERRGELYRAGTDLGRHLAAIASEDADLSLILGTAAGFLTVPLCVTDPRGQVIAASDPAASPPSAQGSIPPRSWRDGRFGTRLVTGEMLWIGPAQQTKHALIRLAAERIALAAETAIQRAAEFRPRGTARAAAVTTLLTGSPGDAPRLAATLGLPSTGSFRVILTAPEVEPAALQRALAPAGTVHDATPIDGASVALLELRAEPAPTRSSTPRRRDGQHPLPALPALKGWVAMSTPVAGVANLPEATREARFTAALLARHALPGPTARFDAIDDLGAYRLLYQLWGTSALTRFATDALGDLISRDRRGTLRETLLAYLTCGGSHVDAAAHLGVHRNTLAYRLKQIAALTGRDPADPATHLLFHLALLAADLPTAPAL